MIHFICALQCEAASIIDFYNLKRLADRQLFSIYCNDKKDVSLTISGIGKLAAAAATSYTFSTLNCGANDSWLNIGIAGHQHHLLGELFIANPILDKASGNNWYPQNVTEMAISAEKLTTLDCPSRDYDESMYDMEASGFFFVASRLSTMEFIHSLKIISDNSENPAHMFDKKTVTQLVCNKLDIVSSFAQQLTSLAGELQSKIDIEEEIGGFTKQWHFSLTQRHKLGKLLHRWQILNPDVSALQSATSCCNTGKQVLEYLSTKLDALPVLLSAD